MKNKESASKVQIPALFLYFEGALDDVPGGVQLCSKEYYKCLEHAGFSLKALKVENDRRMSNRVRRKLDPQTYNYAFNPEKTLTLIKNNLSDTVEYIFLNQYVLRPLAKLIKEDLGEKIKVILLSHGLASVDFLHQIRASSSMSGKEIKTESVNHFGRQLIEESSHSPYIDYIFCLSPFEVEIEKWLGAKNATHIPRTIKEPPLNWQPVQGRLGFVGRLDHPPNKEGLLLFLDALKSISEKKLQIRIAGTPTEYGDYLSKKYDFVQYLGELSDSELRDEASTWSVFVHPIFCYAMGCSTKLAVAIGWEIPIVTTTMGARGYVWNEGNIQYADDPKSLAEKANINSDPLNSTAIKNEVSKIRASTPDMNEISEIVRNTLDIN